MHAYSKLQKQRTVFIVGPMEAEKTHLLLEHASQQEVEDYLAFRHAQDTRWGEGVVRSRNPTYPPIRCKHTAKLAPAVREAFSRSRARTLYVEELHLFNVEDIRETVNWCMVTGVNFVGTGITVDVTTGCDFEYLELNASLMRKEGPTCKECQQQPGHADVLKDQAAGKSVFRFPADIIGEAQWQGLCKVCHCKWVQHYGLPQMFDYDALCLGCSKPFEAQTCAKDPTKLTQWCQVCRPLGSTSDNPRRDAILERVELNKSKYHADATKAVHAAAQAAYEETCEMFGLALYPITMEKIELLAGELCLRNHKDPPAYIGAVLTVAELRGELVPSAVRSQLKHLYRGLTRDRGPREAMRPITIEMLRDLRDHVSSAVQAWAWLVFVVCFFWLLRPNEIYSLDDDDVICHDADQHVSISINRSKTDPTARGTVRRIGCTCNLLGEDPDRPDGLVICPVHAVHSLKAIAGAALPAPGQDTAVYSVYDYARKMTVRKTTTAPAPVAGNVNAFLRTPSGRALEKREVVDAFYELLNAAGIENTAPGRNRHLYAAHSCRRGGAQCMARGRMSVEEIAKWGRWASNCVMQYIEEAMFESALIGLRFPLIAQDG